MPRLEKEKSLFNNALEGFLWIFSSKGIQLFFQFFVLIALARLLDPNAFGIVSAAMVVVSFTDVISMLGIGPAIIQSKELNYKHIYTGFTTTIILNFILFLIIFLSSPLFARFFGIVELENVLKYLSLLIIIKSWGIVAEFLIQRELKFKLYSITNATSYVVYGLIGVTLAFFDYGVWSLVTAQLSQQLYKTILFVYSQPHSKKIKIELTEFKQLYYYGSGVSVAKIFNQLATQGDNLIIGRLLGSESLGLYSRAYQLMVMPANLFGQVMDKVLFPILSKIQDEQDRLIQWYTMSLTVIAIIVMPISVMFVLLAEEFVLILFGDQWLGMVVPLRILAMGLLFRTSYKISDSLVRALGAAYRRAWRQAIYAFLILTLSYIGHFWGLEGVALGVLFAIFINFILMSHLSLKLLGISALPILKVHLKPLFLSIIILINIYLLKLYIENLGFDLILNVIILGLTYILIVSILLIGFPNIFLDKEIQKIKNKL